MWEIQQVSKLYIRKKSEVLGTTILKCNSIALFAKCSSSLFALMLKLLHYSYVNNELTHYQVKYYSILWSFNMIGNIMKLAHLL